MGDVALTGAPAARYATGWRSLSAGRGLRSSRMASSGWPDVQDALERPHLRRGFCDDRCRGAPAREQAIVQFVFLAIAVLVLLFGPSLWVRYVLWRYSRQRDDLPGSGGELARHLIDRFGLQNVTVESTDQGDHYDPQAHTVRLSKDNFSGKSLTAVAVAAHEVGHAIQHARGYRPLVLRSRLVGLAAAAEKLGVWFIMAVPVLGLVTRSPLGGLAMLVLAIAAFGTGVLVHLITLPVEWDASFRRALPILERGRYISPRDHRGARRILRAAALTYVSASAAALVNFWRWMAILRR